MWHGQNYMTRVMCKPLHTSAHIFINLISIYIWDAYCHILLTDTTFYCIWHENDGKSHGLLLPIIEILWFAFSIHPRDKETVAARLLLSALVVSYGRSDIKFEGPRPSAFMYSYSRGNDITQLQIEFDQRRTLLVIQNTEGFEVVYPITLSTHIIIHSNGVGKGGGAWGLKLPPIFL